MRFEKNVMLEKECEGNKIKIEFQIKVLSNQKESSVLASARPVRIEID